MAEDSELTEEWWRTSAFVIKGEPRPAGEGVPIGEIKSLFTDLQDILPALRDEGELKLKGRDFTGLTEWIPGVDPVGELIEETWLPPLPPAVTTLMRQYEDVEGDEPGGGGHLNIMVDLSGSMGSRIGKNGKGQEMTVQGACMVLTAILVNGCKDGGHTFTIAGFGSGGGEQNDLIPLNSPTPEQSSFWRQVDRATRIIWGKDAAQRKNYQGALLSIDSQVSTGERSGGWSGMGGTNSGAGVARMYNYMDMTMKGTEIRTAPLIFLSDMWPGDIKVPDEAVTFDASNMPIIDGEKLEELAVDENGNPNPYAVGSNGFWYWAKKYHDKYGPVILIQLLAGATEKEIEDNLPANYRTTLKMAFPQYIGRGKPALEYGSSGPYLKGVTQPGCFMSKNVYWNAQGGNMRQVALLLNKFIKNMNGEGEICCGGKGINF